MRTALVVLLFLVPLALNAQVKTTNPGFGDREVLKYSETVGNTNRTVETTLTAVSDGSGVRLEFRSVGAELEAQYRLDSTTLLSLSSETLTKAADATVRRTADYRDLKIKAGADDLPVTDMGSLPVVLRGFPWGQRTKAQITYIGNTSIGGGSTFSFELAVVGRESVKAAGKTWDCWKVTTGLGGALALMMPKTEWWFAADGTHPLVKTVGPAGGPGSPMRTLLLQSAVGVR